MKGPSLLHHIKAIILLPFIVTVIIPYILEKNIENLLTNNVFTLLFQWTYTLGIAFLFIGMGLFIYTLYHLNIRMSVIL